MAAGTVFTNFKTYQVESNSCFDVAQALAFTRSTNMSGFSCSTPVIASGSTVTLNYTTNPTTATYPINSIDATAHGAADLGSKPADWVQTSFLLQALLIVAAVFIFFNGYRSGDKT